MYPMQSCAVLKTRRNENPGQRGTRINNEHIPCNVIRRLVNKISNERCQSWICRAQISQGNNLFHNFVKPFISYQIFCYLGWEHPWADRVHSNPICSKLQCHGLYTLWTQLNIINTNNNIMGLHILMCCMNINELVNWLGRY